MPSGLFEAVEFGKPETVDEAVRKRQKIKWIMEQKARESGTPLSATLELTPLCNLDCKMCYVHLTKEQMRCQKLLPVETWFHLIDQAVDMGMMTAALTGGECLTYPAFREIYLYLQARGVVVNVLTNGLLLDTDTISFLSDNPPGHLQISIYGSNDDCYQRVTGHRVFNTVKRNVLNARDAGLPIMISVTPSAYSADDLTLLDEIRRWGLEYSLNSWLLDARRDTGRSLDDFDIHSDGQVAFYTHNMKLNNIIPVPTDPNCLPREAADTNDSAPKGIVCGAGRSHYTISWTGRMSPCVSFSDVSVDVLALGVREAWGILNRWATNLERPVECEHCFYRLACHHCARKHLSGAPAGHANRQMCQMTKIKVAAGIIDISKLQEYNGENR